MSERLRQSVGPVLGLLLFGAALAVLRHELGAYHYRDVVAGLQGLPRWRVGLAIALTAASYFTLTGYDALGLRYVGRSLEYRRIALASFVAYAFSHNLGLSFFGGSAVRFRLYSGWGLSAVEIAKILGFNVLTFWIGFLGLAGVAFVVEPAALPATLRLHMASSRLVGALCVGALVAYLTWSAVRKTPLRWREWELTVPPLHLALAQVVVSAIDWTLAAAVLYALLPTATGLTFAVFLRAFLLAQVVGVASQVPAGLGVFETAIILSLASFAPGPALLSSLVAYRAIYYLLPLVVAGALLGAHETLERRAGVARVGQLFGRWVPEIVPQALAISTVLGGVILLASGATPAAHGRLSWLKGFIPLPVLEVSHLLGSLVGVALLLLARGLQRRLDAAYHLTAVLLAAGIVFSLLKGLDYEEAIILSVMLAALVPCQRHFYRRASLLDQPFTVGWIATILLVVLGSVWLLLLSHQHVDYSNELWWQFELSGNAPRALRATMGALILLVSYGIARLLRPAPPEPAAPSASDLERANAIVARAPRTSAHLVLLGDKTCLFSDRGNAFLMYGVEGRSWVAMGDPVGPVDEARELAWRFRELSDRHGGWAVFYEVAAENLPLYLDLGLGLVKLGEEARVFLPVFSLEGGARKSLRQTHHRVAQADCALSMVEASDVPPLLGELRTVSDAWLEEKSTREKRFSLGFFDPAYLVRGPVAVVRCGGTILAFANLWLGAKNEELSVDLMRYVPEAPPGIMDFLFVELMRWGKGRGYRWFSLGMAPFSGLESRTLAPLWNRLGAFLFHQGEHFYNFQGVRQYKEKFGPVWQPRYLASPGGLALPRVLTNVAALISAGLPGVVTK
jgi:phosphatidylglycerol lysyltransferase